MAFETLHCHPVPKSALILTRVAVALTEESVAISAPLSAARHPLRVTRPRSPLAEEPSRARPTISGGNNDYDSSAGKNEVPHEARRPNGGPPRCDHSERADGRCVRLHHRRGQWTRAAAGARADRRESTGRDGDRSERALRPPQRSCGTGHPSSPADRLSTRNAAAHHPEQR